MKDFSTHFALFDTHCAHSRETRQEALETLFFKSTNVQAIEALLVYGFDPNAMSLQKLMNSPLFCSRVYELCVEHGRDPHCLRNEQYYLTKMPGAHPRARLSDVGYGVWLKWRLPWGKLHTKGVVDWNTPCAQFPNFSLNPLDFALLNGDIGLAHTLLQQQATLAAPQFLPQMVERFLQQAWNTLPTHAYVLKSVWGKLQDLDADLCREKRKQVEGFDLGAAGVEEKRVLFARTLEENERPHDVQEKRLERKEKRKASKTAVSNAQQTLLDGKTAQILRLSTTDPHEAFRQAMALEDNFQLAQRIFDTNTIDLTLPYTVKGQRHTELRAPLSMTLLPNATPEVVRFFIKNGLRGDTLMGRGNGQQQLALEIFLSDSFIDGARQKRLDGFRALVDCCQDINTTDSKGEHLGFALVRHNRLPLEWFTELSAIALRKGMALNVRNHNGQSMEDVAKSRQNTAQIQLLQHLKASYENNLLHKVLEEMEKGTVESGPVVGKRRM